MSAQKCADVASKFGEVKKSNEVQLNFKHLPGLLKAHSSYISPYTSSMETEYYCVFPLPPNFQYSGFLPVYSTKIETQIYSVYSRRQEKCDVTSLLSGLCNKSLQTLKNYFYSDFFSLLYNDLVSVCRSAERMKQFCLIPEAQHKKFMAQHRENNT